MATNTKKTVVEKKAVKVRYGSTQWIDQVDAVQLKKFAREQTPQIDLGKFENVDTARATVKRVLAKRRSTAAKARMVKQPKSESVVEQVEVTIPLESVEFEPVVDKPVIDEREVFEMNITPAQIEERVLEFEEQRSFRLILRALPEILDAQARKISELQEQLKDTVGKEGFENLRRQIEELRDGKAEKGVSSRRDLEDAVEKAKSDLRTAVEEVLARVDVSEREKVSFRKVWKMIWEWEPKIGGAR